MMSENKERHPEVANSRWHGRLARVFLKEPLSRRNMGETPMPLLKLGACAACFVILSAFVIGSISRAEAATASAGAIDKPINFANQIVPIFTKAGCNSGGCHGMHGKERR